MPKAGATPGIDSRTVRAAMLLNVGHLSDKTFFDGRSVEVHET
jgi:hypothetical protein